MRTKILPEDALEDAVLEPLPVVVGGVSMQPVRVELDTLAAVLPHASDLADRYDWAGSSVVVSPSLHVFTPWLNPPLVPYARQSASDVFTRMLAVDAPHLTALPSWWRAHMHAGRYETGRNLALHEPRCVRGVWTARASLQCRLRRRAIPMELTLWPHFEGWSRLTLRPLRRTHTSAGYFRSGHRALDALCAELREQLPELEAVTAPRSATSTR
jgi:hypothetical protein